MGGWNECDSCQPQQVISYMGDAHFATVNFYLVNCNAMKLVPLLIVRLYLSRIKVVIGFADGENRCQKRIRLSS